MGPWTHGTTGGGGANTPWPANAAVNLDNEMVRWFDYWLKGINNHHARASGKILCHRRKRMGKRPEVAFTENKDDPLLPIPELQLHEPWLTSSKGGVIVRNSSQVSTPSEPHGETDGFNTVYGPYAPSANTS